MELRQRKNVSQKSAQSKRKDSTSDTKGAKIDRAFTGAFLVLCSAVVFVLVPVVLYPQILPDVFKDTIYKAIGYHREYVIVMDAGSTGSRLLGFTFRRSSSDPSYVKLEDELWIQSKPGLSSYAGEPDKAAESIEGLLAQAKAVIPKEKWSETPITLKATAGLRLLPKDQADAILNAVEKVLRTSGFKPVDKNLIEIMSPLDEGLFAWFTVNYLLDNLSSLDHIIASHATLDLGGGSTQITFVPKRSEQRSMAGDSVSLHNVTILGHLVTVYSQSYLGLGLMTARRAVVEQSLKGDKSRAKDSPCFRNKPSNPISWSHHGTAFEISGGDSNFEECFGLVQNVIKKADVHLPEVLNGRSITAFSYFYDKPLERGLLSGFGGLLTVGDFRREAEKACRPPSSGDDMGQDFYCLDLTFIYGLLSSGYGLPDTKVLNINKKINGYETSWALGLGYNLITS